MSLIRWLLRRKQSAPASFDSWERAAPTGTDRHILDTRQYLEGSDYQLPKDEEEDFRLNFQHYALYHAIGNHYVAPISPPLHTVLDVGTGTGIWASEIARLFPAAVVVGLDLASSSFKLPAQDNCLLRMGNVLTGLPFPDAFFSYTHQRLLVAAITAENWPRVIHELVRVTRANGWIELVEIDNQMQNAGPATAKMQAFMEGISKAWDSTERLFGTWGDMLTQRDYKQLKCKPSVFRSANGEDVWGA